LSSTFAYHVLEVLIVVWKEKKMSKSILVLAMALLALVWTQTAMADLQSFPICTAIERQQEPVVSGDTVVWQDFRNGEYDIYGYDLSTGTEFPVATGAGHQLAPAISGNFVTWYQADGGVYAYNLSTDMTTTVSISPLATHPEISGNVLLWSEWSHDIILGYDLSAGTMLDIDTVISGYHGRWNIDGDIVAGVTDDGDLYTHDLSSGIDTFVYSPISSVSYLDISGDYIVWTTGDDYLYGYDLSTDTMLPLPSTGQQFFPAVDGDYVVWEDRPPDFGTSGMSIYGHNLLTDTTFPISTDGTFRRSYPNIEGNLVVWFHSGDIYGGYIPEPATLLLLGLGGLALLTKRRPL